MTPTLWVAALDDGTVLGWGLTPAEALAAGATWSDAADPPRSTRLLEATARLGRILASPCCPGHPRCIVRDGMADLR